MFNWRRKKMLIDCPMQLRLAIDLLLQLAIALVLVACIVYVDPLSTWFSGYSAEQHQAAAEEFWRVNRGSWPLFLGVVGVLVVFSFVWSNRLAGPVYRLKRVLEAAAERDYRFDPALRRLDYFKDLLPQTRAFLSRSRRDFAHLREELALLEKNLGERPDLPPEVRRSLEEMRNLLSSVRLEGEL